MIMLGVMKGGQDKESGRKAADIEISTKSLLWMIMQRFVKGGQNRESGQRGADNEVFTKS